MMFFKNSLFLVFTYVVFCESELLDTLGKCHVNDGPCQKDLIQSVIRDVAKSGIPFLGYPDPIDPMTLRNITFNVVNLIDFTLTEGTAKGVKDCVVNKFVAKIEEGRAVMDLTCDITIKGHYKLFSSSPLVKSLLGGDSVRGEGNGKVKIEKLNVKFDFSFFVQNRNGEIYLKCKDNKLKYTYDIKKRMTFFADNIFIGDKESSKLVTGMLNENWKFLMQSFGKPVMDRAMEYVYEPLHAFFEKVPVKHFLLDDLSKYVTNE